MKRDHTVRFVVLPTTVQNQVAALAKEHVAFDPTRRRLVLEGDGQFPTLAEIAIFVSGPEAAAAVILKPDGSVSAILDASRALSAAWVEDAFVRAWREAEND
jgi:hypothetical protein